MHERQGQPSLDLKEVEVGYLPLGAEVESLEGAVPCDFFSRIDGGQFVLVAGRKMPLDERLRNRLRWHGWRNIFIREEDAGIYFRQIKDNLSRLVHDPSAAPDTTARVLHASCQEAMRRVYSDPRALFVGQAHEIVEPMVDLILQDGPAARQLIRLTSYDHATYIHCVNVGIFALALARIFFGQQAEHDLRKLGAGFFLHDLGKCLTPSEIINKPGPLTTPEREVINRHPEDGLRLLDETGYYTEEAGIILLQHHERDDGSGYPKRLRGGDIHPYARICRLADVYEALTSDRPYHNRRTTFEALKLMKERVLADTDPELMRIFIQLFMS